MKRPGERELSLAVIDIETIKSKNLDQYCGIFEKPRLDEWMEKCQMVKGKKKPSRPKLRSEEASTHWVTGQICAVGILYLTDSGDDWSAWPTYSKVSPDERSLLDWSYDTLTQGKPTHVITFNGNEFDMPYLLMATKAYRIPMHKAIPRITGKYPTGYVDIYEQLGKWKIKAKLQEFAYKLGIHDTLYGSGSQVQGWFDRGEWGEIEKHNIGDIRTTGRLFNVLREDLSWK